MTEDDAAALLDAWRNGDKTAGDAFYERYFDCVERFFRTKVDEVVVEDLVQRTFEACLDARQPFERRSTVRTYVLGVANNLLRRHYRDDHPERREPLDDLSAEDLGHTPTAVLAAREEDRVLLEALRRLPLGQQTVIELRFWEGMTQKEMAEILDLPQGTVATRLRDGLLKLKRLLEDILKSERLGSTNTTLEDWMQQVRKHVNALEDPEDD